MDRIGRYKIVRELGRGAMGVVYHAIDPNIGRPVAIKTIRLVEARKPEEQDRLRERLLREARSAGMLSHPGIVTIYDVGQQDNVAYIAMEYVDGPTLDHILSQEQPLAPERMFSILAQTAAALDYAHQKGIVHRDIKPANIMIAGDGTVKITDFGIAKLTTTDQLTITGAIVGTPHYMSPEQVQGLGVDGRSDQFSLAVIAYEILTGEKPYTGEHLTTVVYKIVAEEPVLPHRLNASLTGPIENVVRKGLSKKPEGRYRSCQEFIEALEKACAASRGWKTVARGGSLHAPTMLEKSKPVTQLPPARPARRETPTVERTAESHSGFWPFLVGIVVVTGLLVLVGRNGAPWLTSPAQRAKETTPPPKTNPIPKPTEPAPNSVAALPDEPKPEPKPAPSKPEVASKPSPMPPLHSDAARAAPKRSAGEPTKRVALSRPAESQTVSISTVPPGAIATLDGKADSACTTPCLLDAWPGIHTVSITMAGRQTERREVTVSASPVELPSVNLRTVGGTLMVSSEPAGASIAVNGQKTSQVTPAGIPLPPGTYNITLEKDGRRSTQAVQVGNGITYLSIAIQ
jgi:serine/threonine-protein kinase